MALGTASDAAINAPAVTQWAVNRTRAGVQQFNITKVTFLVTINGFVKFVILMLDFISFRVFSPGKA